MIARLLSLFLIVLTAFLGQATRAAAPAHQSTSGCCAESSRHTTCPACPSDTQKCCPTALPSSPAVTLTAGIRVIPPASADIRTIFSESYSARSDRPLLPPPKSA